MRMLRVLDVGLVRELQAILSLYLGALIVGYSMGFSAVAVPDIKEERRYDTVLSLCITTSLTNRSNHSYSDIPSIRVTEEGLSWFGKDFFSLHSWGRHCALRI